MYIVPPEIWRERYNNFLNQNVTETISAGIIRSVSEVTYSVSRSFMLRSILNHIIKNKELY